MSKLVAALSVAAAISITQNCLAENLAYNGWEGSDDFSKQRQQGCHLDSPVISDENLIRVISDDPKIFNIVFPAQFNDPQPNPGSMMAVRLSLANGDDILTPDWAGDEPYVVNVLGFGSNSANQQVVRLMLAIPSDNEIMSHLKSARYLEVRFPTNDIISASLNFKLIDLRHHSLNKPGTWLGMLDTNDSFGAIQAVIGCVRRHLGNPDSNDQAKFDFRYALKAALVQTSDGNLFQFPILNEVGTFYCNTKPSVRYDDRVTYEGNVSHLIQYTENLWNRLHGPPIDTTEIALHDTAMSLADKHLCPDWEGRSKNTK